MATTVATAEGVLQTRLRIGSAGTAVTDANLFDVMNKVQRVVNYALERKVTTGTLTMSSATTLYYCTTSIAADCIKVKSLYASSRTIAFVPNWNMMQQYDRDWHRSTGSRAETWAHVGNNMIAVYPGSTTNLSCVFVQQSSALNSSDDTFNLDDNTMGIIYDLCEIVLLAHLRHYAECGRKVEQFQKDILPFIEGGEWV